MRCCLFEAGHERSRAASDVVTPDPKTFILLHGSNFSLWPPGARAVTVLRFLSCMCAAHMICMLLGFQCIPNVWCMLCVSSFTMHGLEHGGVSSEEPDVVHQGEMREDYVVDLLIVSLTADDVPCFLSVPLLCELGEVMLHELIQQCWCID